MRVAYLVRCLQLLHTLIALYSCKALLGLTGDNDNFAPIKGIVLAGPSIAIVFNLIALGVGQLVGRVPASTKTPFIVNLFSVALSSIVAISIIFIYVLWDKSWEEDAKNGFSPAFQFKWLCALIIAIQMPLLVALEAYAADAMQNDIVVERAYAPYENVGLTGLPLQLQLLVISSLKALDIERLRAVRRTLKFVVDTNRRRLPQYRCTIEGKKGSDAARGTEFRLFVNRDPDAQFRKYRVIPLPFSDIVQLIKALESSTVIRRPFFPPLSALKFAMLELESITLLESDIMALNDSLPPQTEFSFNEMSIEELSLSTLKAVVAKRNLDLSLCVPLPSWDVQDGLRPVTGNQVLYIGDINAGNRNFLRAFLSLSTSARFLLFDVDDDAVTDLLTHLATTAAELDITLKFPSVPILQLFCRVAKLTCAECTGLSTRDIRMLIQNRSVSVHVECKILWEGKDYYEFNIVVRRLS